MVFDIQGGKVTERAQMIQYPWNGGNNQKWVLNKKQRTSVFGAEETLRPTSRRRKRWSS